MNPKEQLLFQFICTSKLSTMDFAILKTAHEDKMHKFTCPLHSLPRKVVSNYTDYDEQEVKYRINELSASELLSVGPSNGYPEYVEVNWLSIKTYLNDDNLINEVDITQESMKNEKTVTKQDLLEAVYQVFESYENRGLYTVEIIGGLEDILEIDDDDILIDYEIELINEGYLLQSKPGAMIFPGEKLLNAVREEKLWRNDVNRKNGGEVI